jgi:hypothetical protein
MTPIEFAIVIDQNNVDSHVNKPVFYDMSDVLYVIADHSFKDRRGYL